MSTRRSRATKTIELGISDFKARCLALLEQVRTHGDELVVTKHGQPIARVVPVRDHTEPLHGSMRGLIEIRGDIVTVDWSDDWETR
ncbi:MAG TPA: type II toxin-antitoxin system prevent-host-death family antitoxin [Candidatus Binatia bacterium]|jgi:prevent-host-death family protein|nr:type II toxin-antitoxin system prevent-host-death family antitoxin [Candidatus Binatia bacterium]